MALKVISIFIYTALLKTVALVAASTAENKGLRITNENPAEVFNGVYSECILKLSYTCLQQKTLLYLKELNRLSEVSLVGDYVKFVKLNLTEAKEDGNGTIQANDTYELDYMINTAVDSFFDSHVIRFSGLGTDVAVPHTEGFVGRKKRKGGGGGGHGGGDDGGKKKMFMMAMMCMKMKMMMMVPAMMGMMGMMSLKGMMFSMMSFMISKMMLIMKLLEKKGANSWSGGGDSGWAAGGGGAWMPASQDYGTGGYDANGQWQSRSMIEKNKEKIKNKIIHPVYIKVDEPELNDVNTHTNHHIRKRRDLMSSIQNAYYYWIRTLLGFTKRPNFKVVNGVKYVYHPVRPKRMPKETVKTINNSKPSQVVVTEFNKGEIVEGPVEGRMTRRKFIKMKDNIKTAVEDNPWQ